MKIEMDSKLKIRIPITVIMLGVVSLFTDAATEMIYPLIPVYVAALGAGAVMLGIIEGVAETTAALLKLFGGIISDKTGKRKILVVIGYSVSSFFRPLTGVVNAAWQIVIIRMLDRVGKGIRSAPRDAMIASSADESISMMGLSQEASNLGGIITTILSGTFSKLS